MTENSLGPKCSLAWIKLTSGVSCSTSQPTCLLFALIIHVGALIDVRTNPSCWQNNVTKIKMRSYLQLGGLEKHKNTAATLRLVIYRGQFSTDLAVKSLSSENEISKLWKDKRMSQKKNSIWWKKILSKIFFGPDPLKGILWFGGSHHLKSSLSFSSKRRTRDRDRSSRVSII